MLENEKWKSTNLKLNRPKKCLHRPKINKCGEMYHPLECEGSLAQKRGEMAYTNQETGWYDNTSNLYPTYTERISYLFNCLIVIIGHDIN